jgi:predicted Rossmann fold nucleotide-binding protein DprA/Smf involved in DNA uptake
VLEALGLDTRPTVPRLPSDPVAEKVLSALTTGAGTADDLARTTGLGSSEVAAALAMLELAGAVVIDDGTVRSTIAR